MPDVKLAGGSFLPGTKVGAFRRTGDFFPGAGGVGSSVKSATVSDRSELVFKGLDEGRYWAVSQDGSTHVGFTAKESSAPVKVRVESTGTFDPQLVPAVTPGVEITTGATGTKVAGRVVEEPLPKHLDEAQPHLNQASVKDNIPQRSATPLGQATPVDPGEPQPKPRQEDVRKGTPQRSATETGEATPIVDDAGPEPQEDASKRLRQRSSTEEGEQTPIGTAEPRGTASNPDSREQAAGVRSTDTKVSKKADVKPQAASKIKKK